MGERYTGGTVMVGQYTQTRQRKLRVKTVKSGHGRHYKRRVLPLTEGRTMDSEKEIENLKENRRENKVRRKKEIVRMHVPVD